MPIYEYQCKVCGHTMESFEKITDAPLTDCPACHGQTLQKLVSAAGFQLKGTGWYVTDFKNKDKKETKQTSSATSSTGEDKKETSSDKAKDTAKDATKTQTDSTNKAAN